MNTPNAGRAGPRWALRIPWAVAAGILLVSIGACESVTDPPLSVDAEPDLTAAGQSVLPLATGETFTDYDRLKTWAAEDLVRPGGLDADAEGFVYVVDRSANRILKFDGNGVLVASWGSSGTGDVQFNSPRDVAVSHDGFLYVTDHDNSRVVKLTSDGDPVHRWPSGGGSVTGIAVGLDGSVYVTQRSFNRIQKLDPDLNPIRKWDLTHGLVRLPHAVAVDADGFVYVLGAYDRVVQKWDSDGNLHRTWGQEGDSPGQFRAVRDIAVDPDGFLYVVDRSRVQKFDSEGNYIASLGVGLLNGPVHVAAGPNNRIHVVEPDNHRVRTFGPCQDLVVLSSQAEVDAFDRESVCGDLVISGPHIGNVDGLVELSFVGGDLRIGDNPALANLDSLAGLTKIDGDIEIFRNASLAELDGLGSLTEVTGRLLISINPKLGNLNGLRSLKVVGGDLNIGSNDLLANIQGLAQLPEVGGSLLLINNSSLANLDGLGSLTSVGGSVWIEDNSELIKVKGLAGVTSVGESLIVRFNARLWLCTCGLGALIEGGGVKGLVDIGANLPGCNSVAEVTIGSCGSGLVVSRLSQDPTTVTYRAEWWKKEGTSSYAWDVRPVDRANGGNQFGEVTAITVSFTMPRLGFSYSAQFTVWEKPAGGGYVEIGKFPITVF